MTPDGEKISAIVYLAEGNECRCLQVSPEGCVGDLIEAMLMLQEEWEEIGSDRANLDASRAKDNAAQYAIVAVTSKKGEITTERVLDRSLPLKSPELKELMENWQRIVLKHLVARFSAGVRKAKGSKAKKSIANKPLEYWFLTTTSARPNENIRVKFVSLADYQVVKAREGWTDFKDGGSYRSRWVLVKEDTLLVFKDANDTKPLLSVPNVSSFDVLTKKGKGEAMKIKLKKDKLKYALCVENDLLMNKWLDALKQGKSGATASAKQGRKLQLRVEPELIPEYTEEEEEAELAQHRAEATYMGVYSPAPTTYLSIESPDHTYEELKPMSDTYMRLGDNARPTTGQDTYISVGASGKDTYMKLGDNPRPADGQDTYISVGASGKDTYMQIDKARNDVYVSLGDGSRADTYVTLAEASGPIYVTIDEIKQLSSENGYISIADMQKLVSKRGEGTYLTKDEVDRLMVNEQGDYLSLDSIQRLMKDAGYMTVDDMQRLRNGSGEYLTIDDMRKLVDTAGYITTKQLRELYDGSAE